MNSKAALFLFCLFPFFSPLNQSAWAQTPDIPESKLNEVANSKAWIRLLHYLPSYSGMKSELDGKGFFFAPDGKTNPLSELKASLQGMSQNLKIGRLELHPQCAFPERYYFLKKTFDLKTTDEKCPKIDEFFERYHEATGVSIIYSSAYPNNPASMFGHTFLKIESKRKSPLIDTGINFAARTPKKMNMIKFIIHGVMGGYEGMWSMEPYFKKVNEYVNTESRDLWEYRLNLTQDETRHLLLHIWELEVTSTFDYYFFDENCSYQILRAIEAVKLDWDLTEHTIYFIPGESVKNITDTPGAVAEVHFRPSLYHRLEIGIGQLNSQEKKDYSRLTTKIIPEDEGKTYSAKTLDTALTYFLYLQAKRKTKWTEEDQKLENQTIALRRINPAPATELTPPPYMLKTRPDYGHDAYSMRLSGGYLKRSEREGLMTRFKMVSAYHDLLAKDDGFTPFSEILFPWIDFQYVDKEFQLEELGFLSTTSLFPLSRVDKKKSWKVDVAFSRERGLECENCLLPHLEAGFGGTLGGPKYRFYTLGVGRAELSPNLHNGYRLRPGIESGWIWNPKENYKSSLHAEILWNVAATAEERVYEFAWENALSLSRNNELRLISTLTYTDSVSLPNWEDYRLEWIRYFR